MPHNTLDLVSQLLGAARYGEAADLVRVMQLDRTAAGETTVAELLRVVHDLSLSCRDHHTRAEEHWRAAGSEAVEETRTRMRLAAALDRLGAPSPAIPYAAGATVRPTGADDTPAVRCLGTLRLHLGDRELGPVPNRRARSVFKYLLLHRDRPVPKETLMARFWPDAPASAARNSLNVAVYGLRRHLQEATGRAGHVTFGEDCYELDLGLFGLVDIDEFASAVAAARRLGRDRDAEGELCALEAAVALYGGPLFEDDPYEDWVLPLRRELHDAFVGVCETLLARLRERDDVGRCIQVARTILSVEPAHEETHRTLMRCFARQGRRHLALRQYHDCEEAMDAGLDLRPGPETTRLYQRIRAFDAL